MTDTSTTMAANDQQNDVPAVHRTTRVCIKNVPLSFTETKLRQHLLSGGGRRSSMSQQLRITDCRILKTPEGKSRKLAFVGFVSSEMAECVVRDFDQTYALTSKLTVEPAFNKRQSQSAQSQQDAYRPWSQYSVGSSRYKAKHPEEETLKKQITENEVGDDKKNDSKKVDRRKQEFLAAMGASTKPWANDDGVTAVMETDEKQMTEQLRRPPSDDTNDSSSNSDDNDDNDDDMSDVDSIDSGGEGANVFKAASGAPAAHGSVLSDMDFLRSKKTDAENLSDDETDTESSSNSSSSSDSTDNEAKAIDQRVNEANIEDTPAEKEEDDSSNSGSDSDSSLQSSEQKGDSKDDTDDVVKHVILSGTSNVSNETNVPHQSSATQDDPRRLFVRNLPYTTSEEDLQEHFEHYGNVSSCHIPIDDQKQHKGFAFVSFAKSEDASRARRELDGTDFQGRLLHILQARKGHDGMTTGPGDDEEEGLTYKQKQERARQKDAASSKGWSASFVRGDAVVDNLADRLGLRKGDILNVKEGLSSGDAAVRLALGETHIIEENREYFLKEGVDMDALVSLKGDNAKRSTTAILVKNLPYDTELEDLTKLFHGASGNDAPQRILLPPSRTIAMVEYSHATDARRAFRKVAYKRFKHVPIYLEWVPLAANMERSPDVVALGTTNDGKLTLTGDKDEALAEDEIAEPNVSHTVYVKNLNFATTEEELRRTFAKHVKSVRAVRIPTKAAPAKRVRGSGFIVEGDVKNLSMGFGFVECDSEESVRNAIKALQGAIVDGHVLELKRSSKSMASTAPIKKATQGSNPTKLMVRNVPFQATRKELLQLFGSFGQLKKVRLPKKFDGTHRGFAFVEFLTYQEAQTAMNTLSRTHLYGRHLVLEWASDKEDMDTLREKAQRDVQIQPPRNKKIRFQ